MGKLRLRVRALHSARQQLCTLLHRVHSTCRQPHQPGKHLSGAEAYLLRHPNRLTQVLQQLGEENARLEAFIEWRNVEPAFWQWMESVVEVKLIQLEHRGRCPSSAVPCHRGTEGVRDMALDSRLGSVSESLARIERDVRCALWPNHATWLSEERRLLQCGTAPSARARSRRVSTAGGERGGASSAGSSPAAHRHLAASAPALPPTSEAAEAAAETAPGRAPAGERKRRDGDARVGVVGGDA
uniref:Tubulin epsilon and delta complex protein 1 n=1 Tax=Petromyzon marinus TaxID=7757 RepID=A0AAJ7XJF3_PETMA|nr:tubulin epsilon and delta complex protein 1 [Petromyzon marinus]